MRHLVTSNDLGQCCRRTNRSARRRHQAAANRRHAGRSGHRPRDPLRRQPRARRPCLNAEIVESGLEVEAWLDRTSSRRRCGRPTTRRASSRPKSRPPAHHRGHDRRAVVRHQGRAPRANHRAEVGGRRRVTRAGVEKAAAIETPAPYVSADVNDARIRIEDSYRKQGFNDVESRSNRPSRR